MNITKEQEKYIDANEVIKVLTDILSDIDNMEDVESDQYIDGMISGVNMVIDKVKTILAADVKQDKCGYWAK